MSKIRRKIAKSEDLFKKPDTRSTKEKIEAMKARRAEADKIGRKQK
jgi:hypothetical protein